MRHALLAAAAWLLSLAVTAAIAFVLAIALVGPHSDLLPRALQLPVGILLWLAVLVVPAWAAARVYRASRARKGR